MQFLHELVAIVVDGDTGGGGDGRNLVAGGAVLQYNCGQIIERIEKNCIVKR
jgi:hypothetical protein